MFVTAGPMPADPANLLSSQRMRGDGFEQTYDLVLVDARRFSVWWMLS